MSERQPESLFSRAPAARSAPVRNPLAEQPLVSEGVRLRDGVSETLEDAVDNAYAVYKEYMDRGMAAAGRYTDAAMNWSASMQNQIPGSSPGSNAPFGPGSPQMLAPWMQASWLQTLQAMQGMMGAWYQMMGTVMPPMPQGFGQAGPQPNAFAPYPTAPDTAANAGLNTGVPNRPAPPPPPEFNAATELDVIVRADRPVQVAANIGPAGMGKPLFAESIMVGTAGQQIDCDVQIDPHGRARLMVSVPGGLEAGRWEASVTGDSGQVLGAIVVVLL